MLIMKSADIERLQLPTHCIPMRASICTTQHSEYSLHGQEPGEDTILPQHAAAYTRVCQCLTSKSQWRRYTPRLTIRGIRNCRYVCQCIPARCHRPIPPQVYHVATLSLLLHLHAGADISSASSRRHICSHRVAHMDIYIYIYILYEALLLCGDGNTTDTQ